MEDEEYDYDEEDSMMMDNDNIDDYYDEGDYIEEDAFTDSQSTVFDGAKEDYLVSNKEDISTTIKKYITEVKDLFEISANEAMILLKHYNWDKAKLTEEWFNDSDNVISKSVGLVINKANPTTKKTEFECLVCLDTCSLSDGHSLSCGHMYCNVCWKGHIEEKFLEGRDSILSSKCMSPGCTACCGVTEFQMYLSKTQFNKCFEFLVESYVNQSTNRKWCPSPNCTYYIESITTRHNIPARCKCGFRFCFLCHDYDIGDHAPADCKDIKDWLRKNQDESENVKWMQANTKKCPSCNFHIEKNGGCMHMTCYKCRHEFCWLCRKDWKGHSSCNKSENIVSEERQAEMAKTELERYMFFFHRYEAYQKAAKLVDYTEKSERIMTNLGVRSQDLKFLKEAAEQLFYNRNMLKNSYVYAFYLDRRRVRKVEKDLFESLQKDLESYTDSLSAKFEQKDPELRTEFVQWKEDVTNLTRVSKRFLDNFVEGVVQNTLMHPEGNTMTDDERFYITQIETLEQMGLTRDVTLPLIIKFDGQVDRVISTLFG
eukprot:TRINITY_DN8950_c0_g1_i1.p1 TRINITY_DN8950_c0_g1~~TRINITY_DN8950_c0_g1_i1.p1  ORF type:complete len:553 (+),score=115.71 TRINITY_DN8950_c0_g1_i1:34-1659(+)